MKKLTLTTEQVAEIGVNISSLFMAIIFGWSLSAVESVTIVLSSIMLLILITLNAMLVIRRLKDNGKYIS